MAMLEVKDLHVYYGVIQALKGISFEVNQGEVIARSVEGEYCEFSFSVATAPKALTRQPKPVSVREV